MFLFVWEICAWVFIDVLIRKNLCLFFFFSRFNGKWKLGCRKYVLGCLPGQGRGRVILFGSGSLANLPHPAPLPCLLGFSGFGQKIERLIEDCGQYDITLVSLYS